MVEFDLSKITGREPPTDDGLPCACEWNAAGEPVGLCAAHQSKLDDELAALRAENERLRLEVQASKPTPVPIVDGEVARWDVDGVEFVRADDYAALSDYGGAMEATLRARVAEAHRLLRLIQPAAVNEQRYELAEQIDSWLYANREYRGVPSAGASNTAVPNAVADARARLIALANGPLLDTPAAEWLRDIAKQLGAQP